MQHGTHKNVVSLQKIGDLSRDLGFEIVEDDQGWGVSFEGLPSSCYVRYDDMLDVLEHDLLVRPVLGQMGDVPTRRELVAGLITAGLALVDDLDRKEVSHQRASKDSSDHSLITDSSYFHPLRALTIHRPGILEDTILIPSSR